MTWRTQLGERTVKGAEAALVREAIAHMTDIVEEEIAGYADPWDFGVVLFDRLEPPAKLALLAEVGRALLQETDTCPKLTAINEAAVAAIFRDIEQLIQFEIDSRNDMEEPFFWRTRVLAIFHEDGDTADLPESHCTAWSEWDILMEVLSERILWEDDFDDADRFLDTPPGQAAFMRRMMAIVDNYYRAVPSDPWDSDLARIRATLAELCKQ